MLKTEISCLMMLNILMKVISQISRSKLFAGDIVFTYVGTIGEAAIIPENVTCYF